MWRAAGMEDVKQQLLTCSNSHQMLSNIFALSEDKKLKAACLLWLWWTERNKVNHNQKRASVEDFQFLLTKHISGWLEFFAKPEHQKVRNATRWIGSDEEQVKINIDGAYSPANQLAGWGCIARDHMGDVIFAAAGKLEHISEALHAEACAMIKAIQLAETHGMGRVIVETDSLGLSQALNTSMLDRSSLGTIFREAKFLLHLGFSCWSVVHTPRSCNAPAHELAALGRCGNYGVQHVWLSNLPNSVNANVAADLVGPP